MRTFLAVLVVVSVSGLARGAPVIVHEFGQGRAAGYVGAGLGG